MKQTAKTGTARRVCQVLWIGAFAAFATAAGAGVTVTIAPEVQHQTILGWGATTVGIEIPQALREQILDEAVNDLGLTRLRLEPPSGNRSDVRRWEWANDNGDPYDTDWIAFGTAALDKKVSDWVVPFKERVEANGCPFNLYVSPSFFDGGSSGSVPAWLLNSPGEYAEYAAAILVHLKKMHNVTANYYCICNEAGNNNAFTAAYVGKMVKALGPRLKALGLATKIEFPECVNANASWNYIQSLRNEDGFWPYVGVISYHLYGDNSQRQNIRDFANSMGLPTAQTEYMGTTINHLYEDLTMGGVSYWEHYGLCGLGDTTGSGSYFSVRYCMTSFSRYSQYWNFRQVMHYVQPGALRVEAGADDPAVRPLAFVRGGKTTVVLLNNTSPLQARTVAVVGLPAGTYGVCQSVGGTAYRELGVRSVAQQSGLTVNVPSNAVMTIYPHPGTNQPPTVTDWRAEPPYLAVPASSTTLSVTATDPDQDAITYKWSVTSQPGGANAVLAKHGSSTTSATRLTVPGQYVFTVSASDTTNTVKRGVLLNVHAENEPPVADDVHNRVPVTVTLPTSSTSLRAWAWDLEGDSLTYKWSVVGQPAGANVSLANAATTNCTASDLTIAGEYIFKFEVSDPTHTVSENLTVTVYPPNTAPFIRSITATPSTLILPASSRTLLSATTGDEDGDVISHWWSVKSAPARAEPVLAHEGSPETTVTRLTVPGTYVFALTVVDRTKYATKDATVTVGGYASPASVTSFGIAPDEAATLAWTDFASAYTIEFARDLLRGEWEAVPPLEQWPVLATSWPAGDTVGHAILFYRVRGE